MDDQGRYIQLYAMIQDTPFFLINIYAPNKCAEQSEFFKSISNEINTCDTLDSSIVLRWLKTVSSTYIGWVVITTI